MNKANVTFSSGKDIFQKLRRSADPIMSAASVVAYVYLATC